MSHLEFTEPMSFWGNFLNFSESKKVDFRQNYEHASHVSYQVNMLFDEKSLTDMPLGILFTLILFKCTRSENRWVLGVFSVVQNLAGIDAVVLIKCRFRYFARYFDMLWTCRTSCSYTIMQQLVRFWLTHHIARFFCGSRSSCLLRPTDSLWLPRDAMHPRY